MIKTLTHENFIVETMTGYNAMECRSQLALTEEEFAERIGVSAGSVRLWERRDKEKALDLKYNYRIRMLMKILKVAETVELGPLEPSYLEIFTGVDSKLLRQFYYLTQEEFAKEMDVSTATVRKWESKGRGIVLKQIYRRNIKELSEKHAQHSTAESQKSLSSPPSKSVEESVLGLLDVWAANIHRAGIVRVEDLKKLQDDLEYMKGFIEEGSGSF